MRDSKNRASFNSNYVKLLKNETMSLFKNSPFCFYLGGGLAVDDTMIVIPFVLFVAIFSSQYQSVRALRVSVVGPREKRHPEF